MAAVLAAGSPAHPWAWHPHPVGWLAVAGVAAAYGVGLARTGARPTPRQLTSFLAGLVVLAASLTWPLADLAARWSLAAHLGAHVLLVLVVPGLLLRGVPPRVAVAATAPAAVDRVLHAVTHPLGATLIFNVAVLGAHVPAVVDASLHNRAVHALVHVGLVAAGGVLWLTVMRLLPGARRMGPGGRIGFLALQTIVPNVPAAVLLFANGPLYPVYGDGPRALRMSPVLDQQVGGIIVKFVALTVIGGAATVIFFRWIGSQERAADDEPLTWVDVERELRRRKPPAA